MSSEQDKRPSLVPLGVFGTTASAPPPPAAAGTTSPGVVPAPAAAPRSEADGAPEDEARGSKPPAERPSFPRTLVGVPSLSPDAARARRADFPVPPKWQGASAYAAGAPPLRTSSGGPLPPGAQPPPAPVAGLASRSAQPPRPPPPPPPQSSPGMRDAPVLARVQLRTAAFPVSGLATPGARPEPNVSRADDTEQEFDLLDALEERAPSAAALGRAPVGSRELPFEGAESPSFDSNSSEDEPVESTSSGAQGTRSSIPPVIVPDFARKDPSQVDLALPPLDAAIAETSAQPAQRAPVASAPRGQRVEVDPGAPLLGVTFVLAMVALGVGGFWLTRGGFVRPPHPEVAASAASAAEKPAAKPEVVADTAAVSLREPEPAPAADPVAAPVAEPEPASTGRGKELRTRRSSSLSRPEPTPPVPSPSLSITPQEGRAAEAPEAPAVSAVLPETPSREAVTRALDAVRAKVGECAAAKRGVAEVDLTVLGSGDVSHVVVTGDFAGSAEGSCIARVVRGARFAPFQKPRFRLIYPFQL